MLNLASSHSLLVCLATALFALNVPGYAHDVTGSALQAPINWIACLSLLTLLLIASGRIDLEFLKSPLMWWCYGYLYVSVMWFLLSSQSDQAWRMLRLRALSAVELGLFLALFSTQTSVKLARITVAGVMLVTVGLSIYELFYPMTFSMVYGRSAALHINPNQAGEILMLGMVLSISVLPQWARLPYAMLVGVGIGLTLSRGGMVGWALAVLGLVLARRVVAKDLLVAAAVTVVVVVLATFVGNSELVSSWGKIMKVRDLQERFEWVINPSAITDRSGLERIELARHAWERFEERPLLGHGTGAAFEGYIPPHNQYLTYMVEHGVLGATLLPLLVVTLIWGTRGENRQLAAIFGGCLFLQGFFMHGILEVEARTILVALMAAMGYTSREDVVKAVRSVARPESPARPMPSSLLP